MMKQSIASDALKLSLSKIVTMTLSMVAAMLLSRFRTLEEYGTYSQLLLVINLLTSVFMLGLPNSINYFLARAETNTEKQKFLSIYFSISTFLGLYTGLVLVLTTPLLVSYFQNPLIRNFIYVLAIFPWTQITLSSIDHVLIIYNKANHVMIFRILNSIGILLIIFVTKLFNLTFGHYMIMFIILESSFSFFVYILVSLTVGSIRVDFNMTDIRNVLKFSLPLGLAGVVGRLSIELDKLIIGKYFSTETIAIYTNAAREMPVTIFASALTAVLLPRIVKCFKDQNSIYAVSLWGDTILFSYIIIAFLSSALFVFAPEVITLLYSTKYIDGSDVFRVYSLVLLLRVTYFGMILNSLGKTEFIFYSSILSLLLNVVLSLILLRFFGLIGPAIATFISLFTVGLFQLIATARETTIPFGNIFPWKKLINISIINIGFGLLFAILKYKFSVEHLVGEVWESILLGLIWGNIYLLVQKRNLMKYWLRLNG